MPAPADLQDLIERRRAIGADRSDEVWDGEYHMAPAAHFFHAYLAGEVSAVLRPLARRAGLVSAAEFNLGSASDYRVPDWGLHRGVRDETWLETAALVVEILSPGDESWAKLGFYATHGVDEVLVVDGEHERLIWLARAGAGVGYDEVSSSTLLGVTVAEVAAGITWPKHLT